MVRAEHLLVDGERPAEKRLGLGRSAGVLEHERQIVEIYGNLGMLGTQTRFLNGERPPHQRLGLGVMQECKIDEISSHPRMLSAEALLVDDERSPHKWFGLGKPPGVPK